jgi:hypothetical protein
MSHKHLFYLANPFTHEDPAVMDKRLEDVTEAAVQLLLLGVHSYAPISYNGKWSKDRKLRTDWEFWEPFDKNFLHRCDGLIVLKLDGWEKSVGVTSEIEYAKGLNKPIFYITLDQIKNGDITAELRAFEEA